MEVPGKKREQVSLGDVSWLQFTNFASADASIDAALAEAVLHERPLVADGGQAGHLVKAGFKRRSAWL